MALYTTDFSQYSAGAVPSDWTAVAMPTGHTYTVVSTTPGGKELRLNVPPAGIYDNAYIYWNLPDVDANRADMDSLVLMRSTGGAQVSAILHRWNKSSASPTYYSTTSWETDSYTSPTSFNRKSVAGTLTSFGSNVIVQNMPSKSAYFWVRTRTVGTTVQHRSWAYGTTEPVTWKNSVTDSEVTGPGAFGFHFAQMQDGFACDVRIHYIAVGTNGDVPVPWTLSVNDSILGMTSREPLLDLPGSEGSVIYGGWGSFFLGSSYAGSGSGFTQAELGPYGSTVGITSDNVTLVEDVTLSVNDATIGISSDTPAPVMDIPIIVQDSTIGISSDNIEIDATVAVALPQNSTIGISSDSPSLQQQHHLVVQGATIGLSSDGAGITQEHFLVVNDSLIAITPDIPGLIQDYHLIVQEALIGTSSDNATVLISFKPGTVDAGIYTPQYGGTAGELEGATPVVVDQYTPQAVTSRVWEDAEGVDTGSWNSP